jgi:hypothetical protein
MRFKSELDRYLEDELVPISIENFKILDWWKVAGTRYPTLWKVAKDIFAILVTIVASESAFEGFLVSTTIILRRISWRP